MTDVLLATCAELPNGYEDDEALVDALAQVGVKAEWAVWNDEQAGWDDALVVLRSTWDYTRDRQRFLDWIWNLDRVENPAEVVEWSTDKIYLRDLAGAGVPVVATSYAAPGEPVVLPPSGEFVVKPSVGAGSRGAGRFSADDVGAARVHAAQLHAAGRTVLVQPYLADVATAGETALLYFDGQFSHAICKGAMLDATPAHSLHGDALYVDETIAARRPSRAELRVGDIVLHALRDRFGTDLLYVRVDLLPSPDGPLAVEVELIEPSLFLSYGRPGDDPVDAFAAAVATRI